MKSQQKIYIYILVPESNFRTGECCGGNDCTNLEVWCHWICLVGGAGVLLAEAAQYWAAGYRQGLGEGRSEQVNL